MTSKAHITHFDLDGVVSGIFAKLAFDIDFSKCCGYGKIDAKIDECIKSGRKELVVTDLNFTDTQIRKALDNFDKVYYFDHHEGSQDHEVLVEEYGEDKFIYRYSAKLSASAIMYTYYIRMGGKASKEFSRLVMLADTYDMWRTEHKDWDDAYSLNDIFWMHNFWGFEKKFSDGFDGFDTEETKFVNDLRAKNKAIIDAAPKEIVERDTIIIMLANRDAISDVTFVLDEYKLFFIIYLNEGAYNVSVRSRADVIDDDIIDVNKALRQTVTNEKDLVAGGGHKLAGGGTFSSGMNIQDVLALIKGPLYTNVLPLRSFESDIPM